MGDNICTMCGKKYTINKHNAYLCEECQDKIRLIKKFEMVDKAKSLLERRTGKCKGLKHKIDMSGFSDIVKDRVSKGIDCFSSIPEVEVAIQMQRNGLEYETQKDIGGCIVDFFIPEIKIILEIDGELYHTDSNRAFIRDRKIMRELGEDWEIVHIEAKDVPKYTWNLREALKYIVFERNDRLRFRDSQFDSDLLREFKNLELYMKRSF